MRHKISACVACYNEEKKIERCLRSLAWCDEIVVVDSFSTDRTVEICRQFTENVHQHEWLGYIGQRNLIHGMARYPWVLFLDADEEISPQLRAEIEREFDGGADYYAGYEFPRQVFYLGRWVRHGAWYPDVKLRLFRKERGRITGIEPHDRVVVDGPVKSLNSPIWHYTYDGIHDHIAQINRFSDITAHEKHRQGVRFRWSDFFLRPPWRFFKGYILRRGILEGFHGFLIASISAFEVSLKYAKLWEHYHHPEGSPRPPDEPRPRTDTLSPPEGTVREGGNRA